MNNFDYIAEMCTKQGRDRDRALFSSWEREEISTFECAREFLKNNNRRQTDYINALDFKLWLNSLGYIRRGDLWPENLRVK